MRITQEQIEANRARRLAGESGPAPAKTGVNWKIVGPVVGLLVVLLAVGVWAVARSRGAGQRQAGWQGRGGGPGGGPGGPGGGQGRGNMMERLAADLGLTADQQAKAEAIQTEMRPRLEALRSNQALTQEQRREQMRTIFNEQRTKFEAILTPEQKAKMAQMPQGGRGGGGQRGMGGPGGPRGMGGPGGPGGMGGPGQGPGGGPSAPALPAPSGIAD